MKLGREKIARYFPIMNDPKDIALYYAIRLCNNGGAAIYVNRVASISVVINRSLDLYRRKYDFSMLQDLSDQAELAKIRNLFSLYYGNDSNYSIACTIGILPHYANLPNGIKLSIEDAFRHQRIRVVVCTSTLAQGVNIPIRYLFITEYQNRYGNTKIRNFQNLIGRTARSGMYTEGSIIVTAPKLYDMRLTYSGGGKYQWNKFIEKLNPGSAEPCSSSILDSIKDFSIDYRHECKNVYKALLQNIDVDDYVSVVIGELIAQYKALYPGESPEHINEANSIITAEVITRKSVFDAIENHICFICSESQTFDINEVSKTLCSNSLAYHLANDAEKAILTELFDLISKKLLKYDDHTIVRLSRCATGVDIASRIDTWLQRVCLSERFYTEDELLDSIIPLFAETHPFEQIPTQFSDACRKWISGGTILEILELIKEDKVSKAENLCSKTISFELNFFIGNIIDLVDIKEDDAFNPIPSLQLLQRKIKYGVSSNTAAAICEKVFNDQQLAIKIADVIGNDDIGPDEINSILKINKNKVITVLEPYPTYFTERILFLCGES